MTDRPILFSGPMVRAILEGSKTMTRRVIKPQPDHCHRDIIGKPQPWAKDDWDRLLPQIGETEIACPFGEPGDRLWVRETWVPIHDTAIRYRAQGGRRDWPPGFEHQQQLRMAWEKLQPPIRERWLPSIHMPRWASRITLHVISLRAERLDAITEEDAIAEGFIKLPATGRAVLAKGAQYFGEHWPTARAAFLDLWDHLNAKRGFPASSNPWVWVVSFKRVEEAP